MNNLQTWLDKKTAEFSIDSKKLFEESVLCYSIKAYRAGLLFSYLGFLTFIKELIIKSKKPDSIEEGRWQDIISKLKNEDVWEQRVYDELINSSSGIFNISEQVRQQIKYWKDRRNDCAHYKENIIDYHHVEMFWAFLKSNLSKITIEGGKSNLLKKFRDQFDQTKTPPDKSYDGLVLEIENAIELTDLEDFFAQLDSIVNLSLFYDDKKIGEIYNKIFTLISNEHIHAALLKHIFSRPFYDLNILFHQPQLISKLNYTPIQVREIWSTKIYSLYGDRDKKHYLLATLLRNGLIPASEIVEAMQRYFNNFNQEGFAKIPNDMMLKTQLANKELLQIIYDNFFKDKQIETLKFGPVNAKADLIALLIEFREIDQSIADSLDKMYKNINPWWLSESLYSVLTNTPLKRAEYEKVCDAMGLTVPTQIGLE